MFDVGNDVYHVYSTEPLVIEKTAALPNGVSFMETSAPDMEYLPRGTGLRALKITLKKGRYWQKMTATVSGGRIEIKPVEELSVTP